MPISCPLFNRLNPHIWYLHFTPAQTFLALFGWHPRKGNKLALNNSSLEWTQMRTKPWLGLWLSKAFYGCTHFSFLNLHSCRIDVSIDIFIGKCNCVIKMHHCLVLITVCKTGLVCIGRFQIEIQFISTSKRFDSTLTGTQNRLLCQKPKALLDLPNVWKGTRQSQRTDFVTSYRADFQNGRSRFIDEKWQRHRLLLGKS